MTLTQAFGRSSRFRQKTYAILALTAASPTYGARIDCPLRDAPYSVDTPYIDLLANEEAVATIERIRPMALRTLTKAMRVPDAPSFGAIVTPRSLAAFRKEPPDALQPLDAALRIIPVTDADQTRRCVRYDRDMPKVVVPRGHPRILVFEKMTGFRDGPSVDAARSAIEGLALKNGWSVVVSDKGGAMTTKTLKQFDAVVWNNVSGDVLTIGQRRAFRQYIERGGGYVGIHGSAGDPTYWWDWYPETLIGARFRGHPLAPQFQAARVVMEERPPDAADQRPRSWEMTDEWYSFAVSPRITGSHVIASLDESTYSPLMMGIDLRMGDHPIAWRRCVGRGRSFYTAIGHRPATYVDPNNIELLEAGILWAAGKGATACVDGRERPRRSTSPADIPVGRHMKIGEARKS